MNILKWIMFSLMLIGAINWGLVGIFNFDLVSFLFGEMSIMTRIVYALVAVSALGYLSAVLLDQNAADRNCFN